MFARRLHRGINLCRSVTRRREADAPPASFTKSGLLIGVAYVAAP